MKNILLSLLIVSTLFAAQKQEKITIGLGPYIQTQPYKDVENIFVPSPVIFFDNSIFYIRWTRFGMYFMGHKGKEFSWGASITAQPRTFGYKTKNVLSLKGMDERKTSLEGGLALSMAYNDANIEILALTDVLDRHDLWILTTNIGYKYKLSNTTLYPSIGLTYQSNKFLNYYYGVTQRESTTTRSAFTPKAGLAFTAQTYINYELSKKFDLLFNVRADYIPTTVQASPLLDTNYIYSGLVSLLYTFKY